MVLPNVRVRRVDVAESESHQSTHSVFRAGVPECAKSSKQEFWDIAGSNCLRSAARTLLSALMKSDLEDLDENVTSDFEGVIFEILALTFLNNEFFVQVSQTGTVGVMTKSPFSSSRKIFPATKPK